MHLYWLLMFSVTYLPYLLDCKSGKCIQVIDPAKHLKLKGPVSWVGCVALDASESWLVRAYLLFYNFLASSLHIFVYMCQSSKRNMNVQTNCAIIIVISKSYFC